MKEPDQIFFHRDLSWLRFNHRVLQEAADSRNPIYERIKFLAIFSSNLDEFFKVRVSDIRQIKQLKKSLRKKLISKPNKLLRQIKAEVITQQQWFGHIWRKEIIPHLGEHHIHLLHPKDYTDEQKEYIHAHFSDLGSLEIENSNRLHTEQPFIENEALYLISEEKEGNVHWVKIPSDLPRFHRLPGPGDSYNISYVDDIIRFLLETKLNSSLYAIKLSRDAELYIKDEYSGNLVEKIRNSLPNRETGQVTRILYDAKIPEETLDHLNEVLDLSEVDILPGGRYHNLKDLFSFPGPEQPTFHYTPFPPARDAELRQFSTVMEAMEKKDRLLHFPYQSFSDITHLIQEAAEDPDVLTIKITLYRISSDSAIAKALLKAQESGKNVFVFIETKARFDEANNLKWGEILLQNGAKVQYSYPGIKVHSKVLYIEKKRAQKVKEYAYVGTGNFNEKTARIYTDLSLLTCDPRITKEIKQVFEILERKIIIPNPQHIMISPYNTRNTFVTLVENEIKNAQKGKEAKIIIKMNSLQDLQMISLLYKASQAGVKIRLLVRGICSLIPGISGQSKNIEVTSIVDRFLEHSRIYIFHNNGKQKMYIGSADWMTRNLDYRIEVLVPIYDKDIYEEIYHTLELQLNDQVKARIIDADQQNNYVKEKIKGESSQEKIYAYYHALSEN